MRLHDERHTDPSASARQQLLHQLRSDALRLGPRRAERLALARVRLVGARAARRARRGRRRAPPVAPPPPPTSSRTPAAAFDASAPCPSPPQPERRRRRRRRVRRRRRRVGRRRRLPRRLAARAATSACARPSAERRPRRRLALVPPERYTVVLVRASNGSTPVSSNAPSAPPARMPRRPLRSSSASSPALARGFADARDGMDTSTDCREICSSRSSLAVAPGRAPLPRDELLRLLLDPRTLA